ncbi:hypothetical protein Goshw_002581 [Gossypium schwendimanii]|uniref:Uncharacterized protein n=1 Tax=Gossypium schwendimanii TaxID=34291 RepID=A0A7J9M9Q7_GOSSC|nr:hypothetical protein [Gossypium schwendimanii]
MLVSGIETPMKSATLRSESRKGKSSLLTQRVRLP